MPSESDRARPEDANAIIDADAIIDALAALQHGVVARSQLLAAGLSRHVIEYRVGRRRLRPVFRGVYRVGPIVAPYARDMAAVLACGAHALLSHLSAMSLWDLVLSGGGGRAAGTGRGERVDVTVSGGFRAPAPGIRLHRTGRLVHDEIGQRHGIPVTSPARTLIDVAGMCDLRELERALSLAEHSGLARPDEVLAMLDRHPRRNGSRKLRALIGDGTRLTRSEAEERFVALVRKAGLRVPEMNAILIGYEVDCLWRAERLVVEIDGYAFHGSRHAFEQDRRRDAALMAAGFRVLRVSWRQITRTPEEVLVTVAKSLGEGGARR